MFKWFRRLFKDNKTNKGGSGVIIQNLDHSKVVYINELVLKSTEELAEISDLSPLVKADLIGVDKKKFIGKLSRRNDLAQRSFSKEDASKQFNLHWESYGIDLKRIVQDKNKIVLLGNPGLGKSTELEQLAIKLWEDHDSPLIPIHKNLRNFTKLDSIDRFVKVNWRAFSNIIFIFDGIDEISDIEDFTSKLDTFISEVESKPLKSRFLISCRTNVFEDEVKNIVEFEKYYLEDLTWQQGVSLLKSKCKIHIDESSINGNFETFIKNPYQIEIVSKYIEKNKKIPTNTAELWESYVNNRLKDDSIFKLKKRRLNPPLIKLYSKRLSLVNELMKRNVFDDDDLLKIAGEDLKKYEAIKKSPLFDSKAGEAKKFFEHRNIQEYFAALALSDLPIQRIVQFICIENTLRTHPSLFNTITFLINLLPVNSIKFNGFIGWIVENESELLFRSDSNRIDKSLRNSVFKTYFERQCLEKTLWIDSRRTYEVSKIARFADTEENYDYLLSTIKDKHQHFRVRYSAYEVLIHFRLKLNSIQKVLQYFLKELSDKDLEVGIKYQILNFIERHPTLKNDLELVIEVFNIFKDEESKQINSCLLNILRDYENVDQFSDYLYQEFQRAHKIIPRQDDDEVMRGNRYKVEKLILKYTEPNNFLACVRFYFDNTIRESYTTGHLDRVADRCIYFAGESDKFLVDLLNEIKDEVKFHRLRNLLQNIIKRSGKNGLVIKHLLDNWQLKEITPFVATILTKSTVQIVISKFESEGLSSKEYEYFRNRISNTNDIELAQYFEATASKKGIRFEEKLFTEADRELQRNYFFDVIQENLNMLFDKNQLASKIKSIFKENNDKMDWDVFLEIENRWYEENGHGNTMVNSAMDVIRRFLPSKHANSISLEEVIQNLEEDFIRFIEIKEFIKNCETHNWEYKLFDKQKELIQSWCLEQAGSFDFNNVITVGKNGKKYWYKGKENHIKIGLIYFFSDLLGFELPISFLTGSIEFDHFATGNENSMLEPGFDYLIKKIDDVSLFNNVIINNVTTKELWSWTFSKHVKYALEQRLEVVYPFARQFLSDVDRSSNETALLEDYIKITEDLDLLIDCCADYNTRIHWTSVNLLIKHNKEIDFCISRSIEYLDSENTDFNTNALQTLFLCNRIEALKYLMDFLDEDTKMDSIGSFKFEDYDAINDFEIIKRLFDSIYIKRKDGLKSVDFTAFLSKYLTNVSRKGEYAFNSILHVLRELQSEFKESDQDLFYVNLIIDDLEYNYYLSKSEPFEFSQALTYVSELH
ncbi:NACHT domain-containing protein [Flagellimonas sp. S174]|uniref:NACHT domain-containing protein n=1 Tax=Flagellimonas sp. S174 TaxID=3410790 RepID=UPI003BF58F14